MVEWLERLGYGAEEYEFEPGLVHLTTGKLCEPSSKRVPLFEFCRGPHGRLANLNL